ncbi:MAG: 6-carboxytetrahydropterin synthase QueD [Methanolobus sp.]|nr:6-carboxytetrahydropterin synthase QueD [Methanolobus sp.]
MKMRLGIIDHIDSAHYLPEHNTCGVVHGHTYKVEIVIEGEKKESGMVMDFYEIKKIVKEVLKEYDHVLLNQILEYPSVENLCEHMHARLSSRLDFPLCLKIWEGQGKWCEICP